MVGSMTRLGQPARPQQALRSCGLLVAALLLGLLGMHGLGPVPGMDSGHGHDGTTATTTTTTVSLGEKASGACDHGSGGCDGRMSHADSTCASASVAGTPVVVPVLRPDVAACAEVPDGLASSAGDGPDGGRAPPSLSELQLLRI
jgi:hypothetical protein